MIRRVLKGLRVSLGVFALLLGLMVMVGFAQDKVEITDAWGRVVRVPKSVDQVICSGAGCLRYLVYLQGQDIVVGVDSLEKRKNRLDSRPYAITHPELKEKPLFGEFRGHDNPELILSLDPQPQVIFKTYGGSGYDPDELQNRTGIPVVVLNYGHLVTRREDMNNALLLMGKVIGKEKRAQEVIAFFDQVIDDLRRRTADIPKDKRPSCYVGGIAYKGPHGITSTEPNYPPFCFVNASNIAASGGQQNQQVVFSPESLLVEDPDKIFIDLSTIQGEKNKNALYQLATEPQYQALKAVKNGEIYGVLPYNWYTQNHGSILANAYYIGKVLYPERFEDVDPVQKADEIYSFLVGGAAFEKLNSTFGSMAFQKIDLKKMEW